MRQHAPFESIYLDKFEVVEQVKGGTHLYPHTEQLPALSRAINLEFYGSLPNRIAHVDGRADGYLKVLLDIAARQFCLVVNANRTDKLRLMPVYTPERLVRIGIVQQVTENRDGPPCHRFRFFTGQDFVPDIHLSGKRLVFADHVLQRFTARAHQTVADDLAMLLFTFYLAPVVVLPVGRSQAFCAGYGDAFLAFTLEERPHEFFVTTCLTINEMNSLDMKERPRVLHLHYGPHFVEPEFRNWNPQEFATRFRELWTRKVPFQTEPDKPLKGATWRRAAGLIKVIADQKGLGPGSDVQFLDHIPGPMAHHIRADQYEAQYDRDGNPRPPFATLAQVNAAIDANPRNAQYYYDRALIYRMHGDSRRELADLDKAIQLQPSGKAYNQRAWFHFQRGNLDAAWRDITEALRLNPRSGTGYDTRAWIEVARGNLAAAAADARESLVFVEAESEGHYTRGLLRFLEKNYAAAISEWNQAIASTPGWRNDLAPWIEKARQAASDETRPGRV